MKNLRRRSGSTLVEFALVLPLLFLLIVNVVNFAGFLFAWITLANAARAAAQYQVMGPASVFGPPAPTAALIYNVASADISSLTNRVTLAVRSCTNNNGVIACTVTGGGTFPANPAADGRPEASNFVMAWTDIRYTFRPYLPLYNFPGLNINLTLPSQLTMRRRTVMRMLQ